MGSPLRLGYGGEHPLPIRLDRQRQLYHAEKLELEGASVGRRPFRRGKRQAAKGVGGKFSAVRCQPSAVRSQPSDTGGTEKKPAAAMANRLFLESEILSPTRPPHGGEETISRSLCARHARFPHSRSRGSIPAKQGSGSLSYRTAVRYTAVPSDHTSMPYLCP